MSTTGVVEPPHHPNAVSSGQLVLDIVACIFAFLAAMSALRFIQRGHNADFWWDDWTVLAAFVFTVGASVATLMVSAPSIAGAGYHITTYTIPELNNYFKLVLAINVLYNLSVAGSKASIVLFYRRIFSADRQFLIFMRIMGVLIVCNCLAAVLGLIFSDNPVQAQWNVGMPYTSINDRAFWTVMAVVNILLDIMILGIALMKVWKLHMSQRRKLFISSVFLLGAFTIITSILRIIYLLTVNIVDITYTLTTAGIWTNVEMNLSIICACAPIIYNFFRAKRGNKRSTTNQKSGLKSGKGRPALVTIGSGPPKFNENLKNSRYLNDEVGLRGSAYHTIIETNGETYNMEPLAPVHVRTEYQIN